MEPESTMNTKLSQYLIYDILINPPLPQEVNNKPFNSSRIETVAWDVAKNIELILSRINPFLFFELQGRDKKLGYRIHSENDIVDRNTRIFSYFRERYEMYGSILYDFLTEFQETCAFGKESSINDYERWFAQKFAICLQIYTEWNHDPNSISIRALLPPPSNNIIMIKLCDDDDLYS